MIESTPSPWDSGSRIESTPSPWDSGSRIDNYHPTYQYGTSALIIKTQNNNHTITGANVVLSDAKSQCFHRSELFGLIGAIWHINNIWST